MNHENQHMAARDKSEHHTELQSASVVHSGSGDVLIGGSFVPTPTVPVNGSNLPNPHPNFVGRKEEIQKITDALHSRAWIITIDGMGGIGKTTLALEVAHLCKERNPNYSDPPEFNGYIWTSGRDKPEFGLADVVREILFVLSHFEMTTKEFSKAEELSLAIRALAAEPRLLIIDNFETVRDEPLHKFLRDQLPSPSKVLITSRHHLQTGEKVVTVGGLDEEDAVELLKVEAARLQIPLNEQDTIRLKIIASKSYGIPLVLRWAMENVYNGKSLEWVVNSLENATADDIFDYIFNLSLSTLDNESRTIFESLSLLPTWTGIETIAAMNPTIAAIPDRVSRLVSFGLLDDNRKLVQSDRRYQLPSFARYLASKDFSAKVNSVKSALQCGVNHYLKQIEGMRAFDKSTASYLDDEFANIEHLLVLVRQVNERSLLKQGIELAANLDRRDESKGNALFNGLAEAVEKAGDKELVFEFLEARRNPYVIGRPVGPPTFFGRRDLLEFIQNNFEDDRVKIPVISLVGQRRIGKTSILMQLRTRVTGRCKYVFFDLQQLSLENSLSSFLSSLARSLWRDLATHNRGDLGDLTEPEYEQFKESPSQAFSEFIEKVQSHLQGRRLVLMLDELEMLFHRRGDTNLNALDLLSYFRSMVQTGAFGIITAGITPLSELQSSVVVSPFFNIAVSKKVSFLNSDESIDIIKKPVYGLIRYDARTLEFMFQMTGGHPMMLQTLCHGVVRTCLETRNLEVSVETVEAVLQDAYFQEIYFFRHLMMELEGRMERQVLATASKLDANEFTEEQLIRDLPDEFERNAVREVLRKCLKLEILSSDSKGNYRFSIGLLRGWLDPNSGWTNEKSQ